MPGSTSLPRTSVACRAVDGRMSLPTAAILPPAIATSITPSMPEAGQMTWPPWRMRSYTGAAFMRDFLCSTNGLGSVQLGHRRCQIGCLHMGIMEQFRTAPGHGDASLLEHIGAVAELEGRERVLLDHHHRHALG